MERGDFLQLFQEYTEKAGCNEARQELQARLVARTILFITSQEPLNGRIQQLTEAWLKFPQSFEEIMIKVSRALPVEDSEETSRGISWLLKIWLEARKHSSGFREEIYDSLLKIRKRGVKEGCVPVLGPFAAEGLTEEFATVPRETWPKWKSRRRKGR